MIDCSGLYISAINARSLAAIKNGGDQPVQNVIAAAIATAVNSGLFTTTASMVGYTAANIQNNMNVLSQMGYTVTLSSTTLTVSW